MNTEKVFTAFNKDGEEILLYRKDNDTYYDLNSKDNVIYDKENIDLKTLIHASKSINLSRHMLASAIKRRYKNDREKLINTKDILFGGEFIIKDLIDTKEDSGWRFYGVPKYNHHYTWQKETTEKMSLFMFSRKLKIDDYTYNVYINLVDKKEYIVFNNNVKHISSLPNFSEGMRYIYSPGLSLQDIVEESILEKKKVYEYANETRKCKIED